MGKKFTKPAYFKNFNIENRIEKQLERIKNEKVLVQSPRHPSTQEIFKKIEATTPNLDEQLLNKTVVEKSKNVKVYTGDRVEIKDDKDKRPKKENEASMSDRFKSLDFEKYGYIKPEKIRPGSFTLRQFDETVNKFMVTKSTDEFNDLVTKNELDMNNVNILLEYYKPFYKLNTNNNTTSAQERNYLTSIGEPTKSN